MEFGDDLIPNPLQSSTNRSEALSLAIDCGLFPSVLSPNMAAQASSGSQEQSMPQVTSKPCTDTSAPPDSARHADQKAVIPLASVSHTADTLALSPLSLL